jgi:hypothetical protein
MLYPSFLFCLIVRKKKILLLTRFFLSTRALLFPFIYAYLKPNSCKVFQSLYFDTFKEWVFSKVTRNFLIETYSFFEKKIQLLLSLLNLYQNYPKILCIYSQIFHLVPQAQFFFQYLIQK